MSSFRLTVAAAAVIFAACAPARPPAPAPAPVPTPAPVAATPAPTPVAPAPPVDTLAGPPVNWQLLDPATDGVPGTGATRALRELLRGAAPRRTVVVAVIDGGIDTAHAALRGVLWANPREPVGTRGDTDGDGLAGDVHGWNFIGGADGRSVDHERLELTRLAAACRAGRPVPTGPGVNATCAELQRRYDDARRRNAAQRRQYEVIGQAFDSATATLAGALGVPVDSLTAARVRGYTPTTDAGRRARAQFLFLAEQGVTPADLREARQQVADQARYDLNPDYDPRPLVGDTPARGRLYGNGDVDGPDPLHGTHVSGIIAALPVAPRAAGPPTAVSPAAAAKGDAPQGPATAADSGMRGIAPPGAVRVLAVRTVPNGDERDKDVANAIRYAVDHGAQVINMSFGKAYSPEKAAVDSAVRYADAHGVLMVHAAGNESADNDRDHEYPVPDYVGGGRAANWIEVGASTSRRDGLAARYSDYGQRTVDLFAPGSAIYSTLPGNKYGRLDGTSMATPTVTGVAALLMAYFPSLTAADVKRILLASATRFPGLTVPRPGDEAPVPFATLSTTGGVVNAYEAVRMAQQEKGGR
ncbi:peptidase S8 [Gemmatimonadetes bacterium T265]|nr:peptidase S8 [Gemmatimonadetes bacterium T265]